MSDITCTAPRCAQPAVTSVDLQELCREHFVTTCYERIDEFAHRMATTSFRELNAEAMEHFLAECTRKATDLSQNANDLSNLERARLLDIMLRAAELGRHLRRGPRVTRAVAICIQHQKLGATWEEQTSTCVLSRYGAMIACEHPLELGDVLLVRRLDTPQEAHARVAWVKPERSGSLHVGIEFVDCDNFWELDWGA